MNSKSRPENEATMMLEIFDLQIKNATLKQQCYDLDQSIQIQDANIQRLTQLKEKLESRLRRQSKDSNQEA